MFTHRNIAIRLSYSDSGMAIRFIFDSGMLCVCISCDYPIQLRKVVMMPVLMRSTNMAPMIGTMRNGFTV